MASTSSSTPALADEKSAEATSEQRSPQIQVGGHASAFATVTESVTAPAPPAPAPAAAGAPKAAKPAKAPKAAKPAPAAGAAAGGAAGSESPAVEGEEAATTKRSVTVNLDAQNDLPRRDRLRTIEKEVQAWWEAEKVFEQDPAEDKPKFMATFPYPYMNGRLHLGHAFTISKAEFAVAFQRMQGKNALFPFGFHCTGMPIQAAANKLKRQLEGGDEPAAAAPEVAPEAAAAAASTDVPEAGRFKSAKSKVKAKGTGPTQADIMRMMGIPEEEIPCFKDPTYWLRYFPPYGKSDLKEFGAHVDWRRSFITTSVNPYYDSFIRWQFNTLRKEDKIRFGKRPTIYSPLDGQACADHDRATGEGVGPQEYTVLKIRVKELNEALAPLTGRQVFLTPATLRPETMVGQTNCFVLPEGEYGAWEMKNGDVFISSERGALNMSYQELTAEQGKPKCLLRVTGQQLLGLPLAAPMAPYDTVYVLPLLTISMAKGTGVVTSVPSDAPDDYAALRELQVDAELRALYGIKEEWVMPFEVVEIVDIPGLGRRAAVTLCEERGVKSQKQAELLKEIKGEVYLKGFYEGVMIRGPFTGMKVCDAKAKVRELMISNGEAVSYYEPEKQVLSRSGDECVVALLDQWYLDYGEASWKAQVASHLHSGRFETYNPILSARFDQALDWLGPWGCSRSFGLGTQVPWDQQFVIESLSDSTIYMAYYTVCHHLQGDDMFGGSVGPLGIAASDLTDGVWDYIFKAGPYPADCAIPEDKLAIMRKEFEYWYPLDLRVSGKDLIPNHLTMAMYNHAAIWGGRPDRNIQSIFCNGHVLVDGEKMSKMKGNFLTLLQCVNLFSSDATRFTLANSGDSLDDPNFEIPVANNAILMLTTEEEWTRKVLGLDEDRRNKYTDSTEYGIFEAVLDNRINRAIVDTKNAFEAMRFRDALKFGFFDLQLARNSYRNVCTKAGMPQNRSLLRRFVEVQILLLAPICPHLCDYMWRKLLGNTTSIVNAPWPTPGPLDDVALERGAFVEDTVSRFRQQILKAQKKGAVAPNTAYVYVADKYPEWQVQCHDIVVSAYDTAAGAFVGDMPAAIRALLESNPTFKPKMKAMMQYVGEARRKCEETHAAPKPLTAPFDELATLRVSVQFIANSLDLAEVHVFSVADADVPDPGNRAGNAEPFSPAVYSFTK